MSILNSLKSLFTPDNGPAGGQSYPTEDYQGYQITPTPQRTGSQFGSAALFAREQKHAFIRADVPSNADDCAAETLRKAKLTIDQLGADLFR
ncbi:MAG: HlyU family transcriptional regulator [Thiolinea sp.]